MLSSARRKSSPLHTHGNQGPGDSGKKGIDGHYKVTAHRGPQAGPELSRLAPSVYSKQEENTGDLSSQLLEIKNHRGKQL